MRLTADDIVITVMGVTGSGKTSLIQQFCKQILVVGHGLESCTARVDIVPCIMPDGRTIYLIDTPGFDDTNRSDTAILGEIADWLAETYNFDIKFSGIIYLHRITDTRVGGSGMKNIQVRKELQVALNEKDAERQEEVREHRAMLESQMQAARQEARRLEASREELRREMKEQHRREVEESRAEASKRERAMEANSRENAVRHEQLTRELSKMKEQMKESRIKDREPAELKAAATKREQGFTSILEAEQQVAEKYNQRSSSCQGSDSSL
ncbi:P-loop containing nucleoside triphosphate hydrolase protein [Rhexocercosporidium sp. MPI-PUGE-AT-0058]|nr:P-loop containing nucleoside triphosphate hydrolase protein [Rhexocercosporidium sp. MPI-PUGE-AT-0058]